MNKIKDFVDWSYDPGDKSTRRPRLCITAADIVGYIEKIWGTHVKENDVYQYLIEAGFKQLKRGAFEMYQTPALRAFKKSIGTYIVIEYQVHPLCDWNPERAFEKLPVNIRESLLKWCRTLVPSHSTTAVDLLSAHRYRHYDDGVTYQALIGALCSLGHKPQKYSNHRMSFYLDDPSGL